MNMGKSLRAGGGSLEIHRVGELRSRLYKESPNKRESWMRNMQYLDELTHLNGL